MEIIINNHIIAWIWDLFQYMKNQELYSSPMQVEQNTKQFYCPHKFAISGLISGCMKGIFPMDCANCEHAQWIDVITTSATVDIDFDNEENGTINMDEEKKKEVISNLEIEQVEVYDIDGLLVVGKCIEDAINTYRHHYPNVDVIKSIKRVISESSHLYSAIQMKESKVI